MRRVLVAEPDSDLSVLLERQIERLGYQPVRDTPDGPPPDVDAVVLEPASAVGHSLLRRFGDAVPPVVCFSIYPREAGLEPPGSVAYLVKPASFAKLGATLQLLFAA
ncbi:MAG TPA: hypothetical protein VFJ91_03745 [Gaiellaceae bacterium]|nr:hypothetical protein [Gaiellaceae bacterium]